MTTSQEYDKEKNETVERAEMEIGWLEELMYDEMNIIRAVRGFANRSRLAGRFYEAMLSVAEAKGDTLMVALIKSAEASSMKCG